MKPMRKGDWLIFELRVREEILALQLVRLGIDIEILNQLKIEDIDFELEYLIVEDELIKVSWAIMCMSDEELWTEEDFKEEI